MTYSGREWQVRAESLSAFFKLPRNGADLSARGMHAYTSRLSPATTSGTRFLFAIDGRFFLRVERAKRFKDSKHRLTQIFVKLRPSSRGRINRSVLAQRFSLPRVQRERKVATYHDHAGNSRRYSLNLIDRLSSNLFFYIPSYPFYS